VGQLIWCLGHVLWIGNSFMVVTSLGLMAHHLFGCWHGDKRLRDKYGETFDRVKERTSIVPFQAVWEGRQKVSAGLSPLPACPLVVTRLPDPLFRPLFLFPS
jgi:zeta-carotene isomerase